MKLSQWMKQARSIDRPEVWARTEVATEIRQFTNDDEDPEVAGQVEYPEKEGGPIIASAVAVTTSGLVTVRVTTGPRAPENATVRTSVEPWRAVSGEFGYVLDGKVADADAEAIVTLRGVELTKLPPREAAAFYKSLVSASA